MTTRAAPANEWMGTSAACEALGLSIRRLYRMIDTGKIPAYRIGRVIRLRRVDVERARFLLDPPNAASTSRNTGQKMWSGTCHRLALEVASQQ